MTPTPAPQAPLTEARLKELRLTNHGRLLWQEEVNTLFHHIDTLTARLAEAAKALEVMKLSRALTDVIAERRRCIEVEGWTPDHDDEHWFGEMALAAACYAAYGVTGADRAMLLEGRLAPTERQPTLVPRMWPEQWESGWWKPKDTRRNLVRAAQLIVAEIERIDRATLAAETR